MQVLRNVALALISSLIAVAIILGIFAATPARALSMTSSTSSSWTDDYTHVYQLENFLGETNHAGAGEIGMIYAARKQKFSFDDVVLAFNAHDLTARILGDMTQVWDRASGKDLGPGWGIDYSLSHLTDLGGGQFADFSGSGSGFITRPDGRRLELGAKGMNGFFFALLCDSHRFTPEMIEEHGPDVCGIHGWVDHKPGLKGANDFIAQAYLTDGPAAVPLPATALLLLAGLAALGLRRVV